MPGRIGHMITFVKKEAEYHLVIIIFVTVMYIHYKIQGFNQGIFIISIIMIDEPRLLKSVVLIIFQWPMLITHYSRTLSSLRMKGLVSRENRGLQQVSGL